MLESIAADAVSAPSILNTQPWRLHAHDDLIDLAADPARGLRHLDPHGRELLISCGAALMNLRLAILTRGREPVVRLLPRPEEPLLLARIRIAGPKKPDPGDVRLARAIPLRRTSRSPFSSQQVPQSVVDLLVSEAAIEGARLDVASGWHRESLAELIHEADLEQRGDPGVVSDVSTWTGDRDEPDAGIPAAAFGPRADDPSSLVRDFALGRRIQGRSPASFEHEALLAVLCTRGDSAADRLRAGQALERVLLSATAEDLATSLLTQPVEVHDLRPLLRDPATAAGWPQAVLRLGYGPRPPASPRRPVSAVLEVS
jgi:hypothetical protein